MKKTSLLIILILNCCFLQGQEISPKILQLFIAYSGDSTLLTEKYEIDLRKKKIYYITPIMNYLHIKGGKYRTRQKLSKKEWPEIVSLIRDIDFIYLDSTDNKEISISDYTIEVYMSNTENRTFRVQEKDIPNQIKRLFQLIRN